MADSMTVLVVVSLLFCVTNVGSNPTGHVDDTRTSSSCNLVKSLFVNSNLSYVVPVRPVPGTTTDLCQSKETCCTHVMEQELKSIVRKDFKNLLRHNSKSVEGLLATTAQKLQDHVLELAEESRNKTLTLFNKVYQSMSIISREPIQKFYYELEHYVKIGGGINADITILHHEFNIDNSVLNFFTELFPLVYHHTVNPRLRDFSEDYKKCLRETIVEIKPFGEVPNELSRKITKTAESVRVLLQGLYIGKHILNETDTLINDRRHDQCHNSLLKMSYCPKCQSITAKPCSGYCLNVLRGCLTHYSAQLDLPWSGYVQALERLVQGSGLQDENKNDLLYNLEDVFKSLDTKISEAIMYAMVNGPQLEKKVKRACGAPQWSDDDDQPLPSDRIFNTDNLIQPQPKDMKITSHLGHKRKPDRVRASEEQLSKQLTHFLSSIARSRSFYANMAESLCSDDSFAVTKDTADCWNGQKVGEYTKTVVTAGISAQKYNPEMTWEQDNNDQRVEHLSDQLRHMRQIILVQLAPLPQSDSYMFNEEGSGSGHETQWTDDDEKETWDTEGSGSGDMSVEDHTEKGSNRKGGSQGNNDVKPANAASAPTLQFTTYILFMSVWACRRFYCTNFFIG